jgi:O-succinylbenzoic acid--CoA ligase
MMLRWNNHLIDPSNPNGFPRDVPEWMNAVKSFCRFWYSEKEIWLAKTSGSTSDPKTIPISRKKIISSAEKSIHFFGHNPAFEGFALIIPAGSAGGFMLLARAFLADMDVLLLPPKADSIKKNYFPEDKKWFISMLPIQLHNFLNQKDAEDCSLSFSGILLGGGPLETNHLNAIKRLNCPVFHSYGMTETVSHIALRRLHPGPTEWSFRLLEDFEIRINSNQCLEVRSEIITDCVWLSTNDYAEIFPDKKFIIYGRADNVINSGGLKISPEAEKNFISEILPAQLRNFELLGIPDNILSEKLVIVFFINKNLPDISTILQHFESIVEQEKRKKLPMAVFFFKGVRPLLTGGKTDFKALKRKILELVPVWEKVISPV